MMVSVMICVLFGLLVCGVPSGAAPASISLESPAKFCVYQRNSSNRARIAVTGRCAGEIDAVQVRAVVMNGFTGRGTRWSKTTRPAADRTFSVSLTVSQGGWYRIEARGSHRGSVIAEAAVESVGVGEVLIVAGQSNSANHGEKPTRTETGLVSAWGPDGWQPAVDPLPVATGGGGSPWPMLGDTLARRLKMPVGFVSVGYGGTEIGRWQPGTEFYPRLKMALDAVRLTGARGILWHQGESDMIGGTSSDDYLKRLESIIRQSREDFGSRIPWVVALVSYVSPEYGIPDVEARSIPVRDAQKRSWSLPGVYRGPDSDALKGPDFRYDVAHFSLAGLEHHAAIWYPLVLEMIETEAK